MANRRSKKVPLIQVYRSVMEVQDAASQVACNAAAIVGVVQGHCDLLATVHPQAADTLRRVVQKHYEDLKASLDKLYQL